MEEKITKWLEVIGLVGIVYAVYRYGEYQYEKGYFDCSKC